MTQWFKNLLINIRYDWEDGYRLSPILKISALVIGGTSAICAVSWVAAQLVMYIINNLDWIVLICILGGFITAGIKGRKTTQPTPEPAEEPQQSDTQQAAQMLGTNYDMLLQAMFDITITLYQVLKVKKPFLPQELENMPRCIQKGNIILYAFILHKVGDMSTDLVRTALQEEINLNLKRQSFIGISQQYHYYDGQPFSLIQVETVRDCQTHYKVYLTIANDSYCKHKQHEQTTNLLQAAARVQAPADKDF